MTTTDPHSYTDLAQGRVHRLVWDFFINFETRQLEGEATLHFAEPLEGPLDLDTRDLTIQSVLHHGEALVWSLAEPAGFMGTKLTIQRPKPLSELTIRYRTSEQASALQWLEPPNTAGGEHPYLFSQCQPIHARSMVPIQDSPRVRFSYEARATVAQPLSVVMSASPARVGQSGRAGCRTFEFSMPQAIPAYLLALAAGRIEHQDLGQRTRVYAEPAMLADAAWEFAGVEQMLEAAEDLFGPYPWERFDFIVMPPAFPYGGMENPRLTFLTPTLIAKDRSLVDVLAHELAHSWTGNLVTNATMNDFWLNEGFTVWAERRILERLGGEKAVALAAAIGRHELDAAIARVGNDSPLTHLQTDLAGIDPDDVYSLVPYEKGFLFVVLLERTMGREVFDTFLRTYLKRFAFTSIDTQEFEAFLNEEQPGLMAKIDGDRWLRGPGILPNCPVFVSEELEELALLADGFSKGVRPDKAQVAQWTVQHWQVYLQRLPRNISHEDCRWLQETFALGDSENSEILCQWLEIAASSAYEPAFERIESFLATVGRMKYLKPLYAALAGHESVAGLGRKIFESSKDAYHPIARGVLQKLMA